LRNFLSGPFSQKYGTRGGLPYRLGRWIAVMPPSIISADPVIKLYSVLARNSASAATYDQAAVIFNKMCSAPSTPSF